MDAALTDGFQEWISSAMYSHWFYAAIAVMAAFFFVMFVCGMVWLFRRHEDTPDTAEADTAADIAFDYSALLAALRKPNGKFRRILLAADTLDDLPVTIPVNAAIQLAATYKCLLIDLDTKRNAVARVFDAAASHTTATRPLPTPIEHLDIWPAHFFSPQRQIDLKWAITLTQHHYDIILINAPYFSTQPDRQRVVQCAESAVFFTKDKKKAAPILRSLEAEQCRILTVLKPNGHPFC